MKKLLTLLLAALLIVVGTGALAANGDDDPNTWTTVADEKTMTFKKTYTDTTDGGIYPAEKLEFEVTNAEKPTEVAGDAPMITVNANDNKVEATSTNFDITIHTPVYSVPGKYVYTIKEKTGDAQGVTYNTTSVIRVAALVTYDYDNKDLDVEINLEGDTSSSTKTDTIANSYRLSRMDIQKKVMGNLGDKSKLFAIDVTLTTEANKKVYSTITTNGSSLSGTGDKTNPTSIAASEWAADPTDNTKLKVTKTVYLKDLETIIFSGIPAGVSYSVTEQSVHTTGDLNSDEGYTASYQNESGTISTGIIPMVVVTNTKQTAINTGISLDSLPYIIVLGVVIVGAVVFMLRRRRREED